MIFNENDFEGNDTTEEEITVENLLKYFFGEILEQCSENRRMLEELKLKLIPESTDNSEDSDSTKEPEPVRICKNYTVLALNTSISAQKLADALCSLVRKKSYDSELDASARILLYGVSGGGKTAYVEWISKQIDLPLHYLRFSDVVESNVGKTEENIKKEFAEAEKENAILFIDECDSLIMDRKGCRESWEVSQVNEFLIQMERYPGILFCATNYSDRLDSATERRFHFKIEFFPITKGQIELLLTYYFPEYHFTERQINMIYNSGSVVPGDFATLSGRLRFAFNEVITDDYITRELCDIVKSKKDNQKTNSIGFTA